MSSSPLYSAVVIGSTGAIGREVVRELVGRASCSKVVALVRKEVPETELSTKFPGLDTSKRDKLELRVVDFDHLSEADLLPHGETEHKVGFCCLGTTRAGSAVS